ncbi:MAG: hypothetical protein JSR47_22040 [Proteobacteria bacterium]|nr:hypothetical protein [Pseudomonadota bacterium]MBS0548938.1 hypothetical protein [Pseudomonadota bacterium]
MRTVRVAADLPLQQGLVEMATIGAQSFLWLVTVIAGFAVLAGAAFGAWSLRPVPAYSSDQVTMGSAFAVTFRVDNPSEWFALSHLRIRCVVAGVDAADMPPVDADISKIPPRLEPGQQAIFTCPLRAADQEAALRSEIYFRSAYDMPGWGTIKLSANNGPFVVNTKLLPPRWTAKPGRD